MIYGLDVNKEFIQVCALGAKGSKRQEYRVAGAEEAIADWARKPGPRDQAVLEATFHSWAIHAIVARTAGRVVVANPMEVKAIAHARIKTDKIDAYTLARLLQADFLPEVVLPDASTWALRQLVAHRRLLVKQRIAIKNTIRSALNRRLIPQPEGEPFSAKAGAGCARSSSRPASVSCSTTASTCWKRSTNASRLPMRSCSQLPRSRSRPACS